MTEFKKVFFDTDPFIYFLEKNPMYYDKVKAFAEKICTDDLDCVTSAITLVEYCVIPYRDNNTELLDQFDGFIDDMEMEMIPIDETIAQKAAQIRERYK